jgi:hypothetical protein
VKAGRGKQNYANGDVFEGYGTSSFVCFDFVL